MNNRRILQLGKTEVSIHPAVLVYLAYAAVTGHLLFTVIGYLSIALHETAHGIASALWGQPPKSIEITPLGAVMRLEDEERLPACKQLIVILTGPLMTLALNRAAYCLPETIKQIVFLSNLSILLMNLIPVLPLDGGRLLLLLLRSVFSRTVSTKIMKGFSISIGTGLILLNILYSWRYGGWNLSLAFSGCFIIYSASRYPLTYAMSEIRYFLERKIKLERRGRLPTRLLSVLHTEQLSRLVRLLPPGHMIVFLCMEAGTGRMLGAIHEAALIQLYLEQPGLTLQEAVSLQKSDLFCKYSTI